MKINQIAVCAALGFTSIAALAQENTVRLGIASVTIHSQSPDLSSNGPAFLTPQPAGITVGDATTLLLSYSRKINDQWDIELAAGLPPSHNVYGTGRLAPFGMTAKVKQAGPTVFANYKFGAATDKFRPFIGAGVNFTRFYDGQSTASGNLATGGPTKISLSDSVGLAAQIGASYKLDEHWSLCASIVTAKVKSDMTATTGSIERKTTIDFRPVVYTVALGYSF